MSWVRRCYGRITASAVAASALVMALIALAALWTPKRDISDCVRTLHPGLGIRLSHNCDSRHITRDARDLGRFLATSTPSRSRPVHIVALGAATIVLSPALVPASALLARRLPEIGAAALPSYLAGVVLNGLVLALAAFWMVRLVEAREPLLAAGVAGLAASYDVTIAWLWVPHQIMLNVLVPVGGVVAWLGGRQAGRASPAAVARLGLATAAACLAYGYCLVWPLAFALGVAATSLERGAWPEPGEIVRALVYGASAAGPLILYFGAYWLAGRDVAYEAQSVGQFQWVAEAWRQGRLPGEAVARLGNLALITGRYLGLHGLALAIAAGGLAALAIRAGRGREVRRDPVLQGATVTLLLMLAFNYLQGYHQARLLLFPLLLLGLAVLRLLPQADATAWRAPVVWGLVALQLALAAARPPISME